MASRSGITVYVLIGLVALGSSRDPACEAPQYDDDFSFEPESEVAAQRAADAGEDFSFEPEPTPAPEPPPAPAPAPGPAPATDPEPAPPPEPAAAPAPGSASPPEPASTPAPDPGPATAAAEPDADGDPHATAVPDAGSDASGPVDDPDVTAADPASCNDAVVVESAAGGALVPVGTDILGSSADLDCTMQEGDGDDDAVTVLQDALARCNGQAVTADGGYGPLTRMAVAAVEQQHGVPADGVYGPETRQVMQWPTLSGAGCAGGVAPPAG